MNQKKEGQPFSLPLLASDFIHPSLLLLPHHEHRHQAIRSKRRYRDDKTDTISLPRCLFFLLPRPDSGSDICSPKSNQPRADPCHEIHDDHLPDLLRRHPHLCVRLRSNIQF